MTDENQQARRSGWSLFGGILIALGLLAVLYTKGRVLHVDWVLPLVWLVGPLGLLFALRGRNDREGGEPEATSTDGRLAAVLVGGCLLFLISSGVLYKWFYFLDWPPPAEDRMAFSGLALFALLVSFALPLVVTRVGRSSWFYLSVLVVFQVLAYRAFLGTAHGHVLYNDDHPSFLFRLWVLGQTFPRLLNYNPLWNAGYLDTAALETGAVVPGLLLLPLWKWGSILQVYNHGVLILYVILIPLIAAASLRIMGGSWVSAWIAALLALGVSRNFFLWLFNYGTIGANCVAAFVIPVAACLYRACVMDRRERWLMPVLIGSVLLLMLWPIGAFMIFPLALPVLLHRPSWSWPRLRWLLLAGGIFALLVLYPILVILQHTDVAAQHWVKPLCAHTDLSAQCAAGWEYLRDHIRQGHPLLIFLGLGGALASFRAGPAGWFAPILLGFLFLTGWGQLLVPDLPLNRMAIPLFFAAVPPAALLGETLLRSASRRLVVLRAALLALLLAGGWNISRIYANTRVGPYDLMPQDIEKLGEWGRNVGSPGDRVWIAGATGHNYGGGHVPFLPVLLGREMLSSEYRHDQVQTLAAGSGPGEPPASVEELDRYLALFAARDVITLDDDWQTYLAGQRDRFEDQGLFPSSNIRHFRVLHPTSLFLAGSGRVQASLNKLHVELDDPGQEAVIRYLWFDGMKASPPADVFPYDAGNGVKFIGIRPRGATSINIQFTRWI